MQALFGTYAPAILHGQMKRAKLSVHGLSRFYQLVAVREGGFELRSDGDVLRAGPGDVLLIPPATRYEWRSHPDSASSLVAFTIMTTPLYRRRPGKQALQMSDEAGTQSAPQDIWGIELPLFLPPELSDCVREPINSITSTWWRSDAQHFEANQRLAYVLERIVAFHRVDPIRKHDYRPDQLVGRTLALIHEHYAVLHSAKEMANLLGISVSQLDHVFKHHCGETPVAALRRYRLAETERLLLSWDVDIQTVAEAVGFRSGKALHQAWMQTHELPPREWRRLQKYQ